ncbi:MAG: hypothetical protein WKF43_12900 [Acidimicrobiales bacterium]
MSALEQLLVVQDHDTRADQLRHRRTALPERSALVEAETERKRVGHELAGVEVGRDALSREQQRLEDDIAVTEERIRTVDRVLYSGTTTNPRDLQAFQDEVTSLKRRVSLLEDQELAVMEQLEPTEVDRRQRAEVLRDLEAEIERLSSAVTVAEAELDVDLQANAVGRAEAASAVDAGLLAEYEAIRARSAGVGVARLVAGVCGGCRLGCPRSKSIASSGSRRRPSSTVTTAAGCSCTDERRCSSGSPASACWPSGRCSGRPRPSRRDGGIGGAVVEVLTGGPRVLHAGGGCGRAGPRHAGPRRRRLVRRRLLGLPVELFMHLVLDGVWADTEVFWWPFFGLSFSSGQVPEATRGALGLAMELVGAASLWFAWRRFGLDDPARRATFVRAGRIDRDLVP